MKRCLHLAPLSNIDGVKENTQEYHALMISIIFPSSRKQVRKATTQSNEHPDGNLSYSTLGRVAIPPPQAGSHKAHFFVVPSSPILTAV